jgi:hypothetical protein
MLAVVSTPRQYALALVVLLKCKKNVFENANSLAQVG